MKTKNARSCTAGSEGPLAIGSSGPNFSNGYKGSVLSGVISVVFALPFLVGSAGAQQRIHDFSVQFQGIEDSVTVAGGDQVVVAYTNKNSSSRPICLQGFNLEGQRIPGGIPGLWCIQASQGGGGNFNLRPQVVSNATGRVGVVWEASAGGGVTNVLVRSFTKSLQPHWDEVQVNEPGQTDNQTSSVGIDASGNLTLVWRARVDGNVTILGRHLTSSGTPTGAVFEIPTAGVGEIEQPIMAMDDSGRFQVLWLESNNDRAVVVSRSFAAGAATGTLTTVHEELLDGGPSFSFQNPDLQASGNGNFIAGWRRRGWRPDFSGMIYDLMARPLSATGQGVIPAVSVVAESPDQTEIQVAIDDTGVFAAAWWTTTNGNSYGLQAQRYSATGDPLGSSFEGTPSSTPALSSFDVDMSPAGDVAITRTRGSTFFGNTDVQGRIATPVENTAPVAVTDEYTVHKNNILEVDLMENDFDDDGDDLSFVHCEQPVHGTVEIIGGGSIRYLPEPGYVGMDSFTYEIEDEMGSGATGTVEVEVVAAPVPLFIQGADMGAIAMSNSGQILIAQTRTPFDPTAPSPLQPSTFNQWFDVGLNPVSGPSEVSFATSFPSRARDVAVGPNGHHAVVWHIDGGPSLDTVYFRLFAPDGTPSSGAVPVSLPNTLYNRDPRVAVDGSGNAVVAWNGQRAGTSSLTFARRFSPDGTALTDELVVTPPSSLIRDFADVGMSENGDALIIWEEDTNPPVFSIKARRFTSNGTLGNEFMVAEGNRPSLAINESGAWVVAWKDSEGTGQIRARLYASDDQLVRELPVSTAPLGSRFPQNPAAALSAGGNFVVVWDQLHLGGGGQRDVLFREFDDTGLPLSDPAVVNEPGRESNFPRAAMDAEGNIVVLWQDSVQDDEYGLKGRWFASSSPTGPDTVSYADWMSQFFPNPDDPDADPEADPDGDTIINRLEFAFAGDPNDSSLPNLLPMALMNGGQAIMEFGRLPDADLEYVLQHSFGLNQWTDAIPGVDYQETSVVNPVTQVEEVRMVVSPNLLVNSNGLFLRLRVVDPQ